METGDQIAEKFVFPEDISKFENFGYKFDKFLQNCFESWARNVVCRFPKTTILFSLAWSLTLSAGIIWIEFTTGMI
jgi:hypothetical protein